MAESTVSQITPIVNENTPVSVEFIDENTPAVRSDRLAEHFNRSHKNVLRDIAKLRAKCPESFFGLNFEPKEIDVKTGFGIRKDRAYLLTRDAFTLLVMGFTGAAVVRDFSLNAGVVPSVPRIFLDNLQKLVFMSLQGG